MPRIHRRPETMDGCFVSGRRSSRQTFLNCSEHHQAQSAITEPTNAKNRDQFVFLNCDNYYATHLEYDNKEEQIVEKYIFCHASVRYDV